MRTTLTVLAVLAMLVLAGCLQAGTPDAPAPPGPAPEPTPEEFPSVAPRPGEPGARDWPEPSEAAIRPGVQIRSPIGQCTSNFVYTSPHNDSVYLGFAAHCVAEGESTETNGCEGPDPLPAGTEVEVAGASHPAVLAYSAWETMQAVGETGQGACRFNDFAVVEIHPEDVAHVSPAVLRFGGPTGLAAHDNVSMGDRVLSYGNSGLRPGPDQLDWKEGYVLDKSSDGWSYTVMTASPGVPGDSGSNMLLASGEALGVVVTLAAAPVPGSNGVTDLASALAYARQHGFPLQIVTWDLLDPGLLP